MTNDSDKVFWKYMVTFVLDIIKCRYSYIVCVYDKQVIYIELVSRLLLKGLLQKLSGIIHHCPFALYILML